LNFNKFYVRFRDIASRVNRFLNLVRENLIQFPNLTITYLLHFRRSNARQSTLSSHEKKELRLAVMLMVVVLVSYTQWINKLGLNFLFKSFPSEKVTIKAFFCQFSCEPIKEISRWFLGIPILQHSSSDCQHFRSS